MQRSGQINSQFIGQDPDELLSHRTEPVRFDVHPEEMLDDLGYWELYDQAEVELDRRYDALHLPSSVTQPDGSTTTGDQAPWTDGQEAAAESILALHDQLDALRRQDIASYGEAMAAALRTAVTDLFPSLRFPVQISVHLSWAAPALDAQELWWAVWERARNRAPLPSSGIAVQDYPPGASIVDVERDAGRGPLARIQRSFTDQLDRRFGALNPVPAGLVALARDAVAGPREVGDAAPPVLLYDVNPVGSLSPGRPTRCRRPATPACRRHRPLGLGLA